MIVLATFDMGGAERQALHLASYLQDARRAQVAVVALFGGTGNQIVRKKCVERRLACLRVSMPEHQDCVPTFHSVRQFAREMRFLRPEILLPYTALPNVLCGVTWRMAGAKSCVWNQRDGGLNLARERWALAAMGNTERFIANSQSARDCLVKQYGVAEQRVNVIPNGVHLPPAKESREGLRKRLGIEADAFVGVMVASLYPVKDHATLMRAWKIVCDRLPHAHPTLLLAGKEIDARALRALIAELGIESQVRFLGAVDDISSLLHAVDVSVFSSENEGMPNAVLESMAAGVPVVTTDISGCRDALGEDYAYLAPPKSPEQFADCVVTLARDEGTRKSVGGALQRRTREQFTVEKMCQRTCEVLENAEGL